MRGNDAELPVIANELARSVSKIVDLCPVGQRGGKAAPACRDHGAYAYDLLLLIGNRKFCRHVVASAPGTAISLFQKVSETKKYILPVRQFAVNVSTEAIRNTDSILYHEDEGYSSGLLGYIKPFSAALYGDYRLVESLGHDFGSPLDIDYRAVDSWNATQLGAYCRVVLITFSDYLTKGAWPEHSFALARAFHNIENAFSDAYKLNDPQTPFFPSDVLSRIDAAVKFVGGAMGEIGKINPLPSPVSLRPGKHVGAWQHRDMYDALAEQMFKLILAASHVTSDQDRSWAVQNNTVWTNFFRFVPQNKAWSIVQFKLRRLIFEAITNFEFLDYQSARVLGLCLNVLGFESWAGQSAGERVLQKALVSWAKRSFLRRYNDNPEVAVSGLPAGISFDADNRRFVKTYAKGLARQAPQIYLDLDK